MNICVLLSTYNGERYLEEQLESLVTQENINLDILVRDDGSSDSTCKILDEWQNKGLLKWYSGGNKGFGMSFMDLVQNSGDYDYYAFCDQDDIWLPNKMKVAISHLQEMGTSPSLYFSNLTYWKDGVTYGNVKSEGLFFDYYTCLIQCQAYGCTMVFNHELAKIIKEHLPQDIYAHDFWVYQTAILLGSVFYDKESYIFYRQHQNNVIGAKMSFSERWERRIKKSLPKLMQNHKLEYSAKELLVCYGNLLSPECKKAVETVACYRQSIFNYLKLLLSTKFRMNSVTNTLIFKLKVLICKI